LIEVQQNADLTYRLFDYSRNRGLQIAEAVSAANAGPYQEAASSREVGPGREIVAQGSAFALERWTGVGSGRLDDARWWIVPLDSGGLLDGQPLRAGEVWIVDGGTEISVPEGCSLLVAYPGDAVREQAFRD
jgi:mannose-6-phosphate isomerase